MEHVDSESIQSEIDHEFREHVAPRRTKAGSTRTSDDTWGLALSGGGIRSATLSLGLVRALAENGILKDFDYLSTVSGGGYLGASLGRLYQNAEHIADIEAKIAKPDSTTGAT